MRPHHPAGFARRRALGARGPGFSSSNAAHTTFAARCRRAEKHPPPWRPVSFERARHVGARARWQRGGPASAARTPPTRRRTSPRRPSDSCETTSCTMARLNSALTSESVPACERTCACARSRACEILPQLATRARVVAIRARVFFFKGVGVGAWSHNVTCTHKRGGDVAGRRGRTAPCWRAHHTPAQTSAPRRPQGRRESLRRHPVQLAPDARQVARDVAQPPCGAWTLALGCIWPPPPQARERDCRCRPCQLRACTQHNCLILTGAGASLTCRRSPSSPCTSPRAFGHHGRRARDPCTCSTHNHQRDSARRWSGRGLQ